ncbi:MAG: PTS sugar transporter subunit IIC [Myxococcaceae bacterium]
METQIALAALWGGFVALERRAFLQAMLARPLVAATVMGLLLGDTNAGLYVGMLLELFFLGSASLGAALPDNDTLTATGSTAGAIGLASALGVPSTPAMWSLSILIFVGLGRLGRSVERLLEGYSARVAKRALQSAESGDLKRAVRQNLWGMWPHFVAFGLINAACFFLAVKTAPTYARVPVSVLRGLEWACPGMASVAAAVAVRGSHARKGLVWAGVTAALVTSGTAVFALLRESLMGRVG